MSIFTALRAGVSGLASNSSALATISDNIANVNTVGYKRVQSEFSALISTSDINSTIFNAGGVTSSTRRFVDVQGPTEQTASPTDLAIIGDGFFIVTDDAAAQNGAGGALFTRAGSFSLDGAGRLVNAQGFFLLGAPLLTGQADPNPTSLAALQPINLSGVGANAEATSTIAINANLDQRTPQGSAAVPGSFSGTTPSAVAQVERSVDFIDSVGTPRALTLGFTRVGPQEWQLEVFIRPPNLVDQVPAFNVDANAPAGVDPVFDLDGDGTLDAPPAGSTVVAGPPATYQPPQGYIASGRIQFNQNGQVVNFLRDGQAAPATPTTRINFQVPFTSATGVAQQQIDFGIGSVTQFSIPSTLRSVTADGSVPGDLTGVSVSPSGVLSAQFSNGQTEELFLIPTATFLNPNALQPERGSTFRLTPESGLFTLNTPGEGGSGVIQANAVETSNVDLGAEFANLIITQRAYTASSQIIQTADQLLQELINIPN